MSSAGLRPLPPYDWPNPPAKPDGSVPPELVEQYKAELTAHNEFIKQQLEESFAQGGHRRSLEQLDRQAQIGSAAAASLAEVNRQAATAQAGFAAAAATAATILALANLRSNFINSSVTEIHKAYIEVAKGSIDRMQKRAELLQAAAIAIGTLYTGLLAFFFITADKITKDNVDQTETLPSRGIIPAVFLGCTVVFAMAYLAFRTVPGEGMSINNEAEPLDYIEQQRNLFVDWVNYIRWWRVALIQLAVISLGLAVATLPVAFINVANDEAVTFIKNTVIVILAVWIVGWLVYGSRSRNVGWTVNLSRSGIVNWMVFWRRPR